MCGHLSHQLFWEMSYYSINMCLLSHPGVWTSQTLFAQRLLQLWKLSCKINITPNLAIWGMVRLFPLFSTTRCTVVFLPKVVQCSIICVLRWETSNVWTKLRHAQPLHLGVCLTFTVVSCFLAIDYWLNWPGSWCVWIQNHSSISMKIPWFRDVFGMWGAPVGSRL